MKKNKQNSKGNILEKLSAEVLFFPLDKGREKKHRILY